MINKPNDPKNKDFDPDIDLDDSAFEYGDIDSDFESSGDEELLESEQDWQDEEPQNKKTSRGKKDFSRSGKKGMSFNTMVIIGAVILGGGVLVFNVMNQSGKQAENAQGAFQSSMSVSGVIDGALNPAENAAPVPSAPDAPAESPQDAAAPSDGGFLNEGLGELAAPAQSDAGVPPQPAPVAPVDSAAPAAADIVTPMPEQQATVIDVADNAVVPQEIQIAPTMPEAEQAPVDATTQIDVSAPTSPDVNVAPEPTIAPVQPQATPSVDSAAAMAQIEEKLSDILSRMEKIEADMKDIRSGQSGDIKELEKTVMSLKRDLGEVKQSPAPKKESAPAKPKEPKTAKAPVIEPYPKVALPKPTERPKTEAPKAQTPVVAPAPTPAPVAASGAWELRAAQPGRAWVSKAGDRDMQSVEVGQKLKGVGTITAIEYQNGRWVVRGSEGQITQ